MLSLERRPQLLGLSALLALPRLLLDAGVPEPVLDALGYALMAVGLALLAWNHRHRVLDLGGEPA